MCLFIKTERLREKSGVRIQGSGVRLEMRKTRRNGSEDEKKKKGSGFRGGGDW